MYDYEYEFEILCFLRLMKYLHSTKQHSDFYHSFADYNVDENEIYMVADLALWEISSPDAQLLADEEEEVFVLFDPRIDKHIELCQALHHLPMASYVQKITDIACYFLADRSHSVWDLHCKLQVGSISVRYTLNPDYYDPLLLGSEMVDFFLYFEYQNAWMEQQLQQVQDVIQIAPKAAVQEAA